MDRELLHALAPLLMFLGLFLWAMYMFVSTTIFIMRDWWKDRQFARRMDARYVGWRQVYNTFPLEGSPVELWRQLNQLPRPPQRGK